MPREDIDSKESSHRHKGGSSSSKESSKRGKEKQKSSHSKKHVSREASNESKGSQVCAIAPTVAAVRSAGSEYKALLILIIQFIEEDKGDISSKGIIGNAEERKMFLQGLLFAPRTCYAEG